jgi:hypothetical protein
MKAVYIILAVVLCSFGIVQRSQISDMPGAYKLLSKIISIGTTDSVVPDVNQLKIYIEDYFMYAGTQDSVASFSIGSYTKEGGKLTEHVLFSSSGTSRFEPTNLMLDIDKTLQGYKQIFKDTGPLQGKKFSYMEEYKYVGTKTKCPMDGAWKQLESYGIKNKDTTWDNGINYKICKDGYIIWGDFHRNATTKQLSTFMGFSTFEMKGNKGTELCINSNYFQNKGKTFTMDIEFRNSNEFKQTITDSLSGIRYVEIFQRLKSNKG